MRIMFIWQRKSFNYVYGFKGDHDQMNNPKYEILSSYPEMDKYYGVMAGLAYTLPDSIFGLMLGLMADGFNRKNLLVGVTFLAGATQLATGFVDSLGIMFLMRMAHAACNSVTNPLFFSIVADYFPRSQRGTANSLL